MSFHGVLGAMIFAFLYLYLILLFKMAPKCSAEVLPSVRKCKKAVLCFVEKICVADRPCSSMSYRLVGHQFSVNESTIYILKRYL